MPHFAVHCKITSVNWSMKTWNSINWSAVVLSVFRTKTFDWSALAHFKWGRIFVFRLLINVADLLYASREDSTIRATEGQNMYQSIHVINDVNLIEVIGKTVQDHLTSKISVKQFFLFIDMWFIRVSSVAIEPAQQSTPQTLSYPDLPCPNFWCTPRLILWMFHWCSVKIIHIYINLKQNPQIKEKF